MDFSHNVSGSLLERFSMQQRTAAFGATEVMKYTYNLISKLNFMDFPQNRPESLLGEFFNAVTNGRSRRYRNDHKNVQFHVETSFHEIFTKFSPNHFWGNFSIQQRTTGTAFGTPKVIKNVQFHFEV